MVWLILRSAVHCVSIVSTAVAAFITIQDRDLLRFNNIIAVSNSDNVAIHTYHTSPAGRLGNAVVIVAENSGKGVPWNSIVAVSQARGLAPTPVVPNIAVLSAAYGGAVERLENAIGVIVWSRPIAALVPVAMLRLPIVRRRIVVSPTVMALATIVMASTVVSTAAIAVTVICESYGTKK